MINLIVARGWLFIKHIKKDVNKVLLFLIIVPLLLFAWFSVYYQSTLKNISLEYNKSREKLEETTGKIVLEQLNETLKSKETALQDKEALEKGYYDLKVENEDLKLQKESLETELNSVKSELQDTKNKFNIIQTRFQEVQNGLSKAYDDMSILRARIKELCSKLEAAGSSDEKC